MPVFNWRFSTTPRHLGARPSSSTLRAHLTIPHLLWDTCPEVSFETNMQFQVFETKYAASLVLCRLPGFLCIMQVGPHLVLLVYLRWFPLAQLCVTLGACGPHGVDSAISRCNTRKQASPRDQAGLGEGKLCTSTSLHFPSSRRCCRWRMARSTPAPYSTINPHTSQTLAGTPRASCRTGAAACCCSGAP